MFIKLITFRHQTSYNFYERPKILKLNDHNSKYNESFKKWYKYSYVPRIIAQHPANYQTKYVEDYNHECVLKMLFKILGPSHISKALQYRNKIINKFMMVGVWLVLCGARKWSIVQLTGVYALVNI